VRCAVRGAWCAVRGAQPASGACVLNGCAAPSRSFEAIDCPVAEGAGADGRTHASRLPRGNGIGSRIAATAAPALLGVESMSSQRKPEAGIRTCHVISECMPRHQRKQASRVRDEGWREWWQLWSGAREWRLVSGSSVRRMRRGGKQQADGG
jgi:hypothetical protein